MSEGKAEKAQQTTAERLADHRSGRNRLSDEELREISTSAYVAYSTLV